MYRPPDEGSMESDRTGPRWASNRTAGCGRFGVHSVTVPDFFSKISTCDLDCRDLLTVLMSEVYDGVVVILGHGITRTEFGAMLDEELACGGILVL